jgi:hypothetical protein
MNTAIVVKNEDTAAVMMELKPPDLVFYGVADIGKDLEIGPGYEIIQAVAGGSSIARSAVMPILAVGYPDEVPGLGPPFPASRVFGWREKDIVAVLVLARLLPGAELEDKLLLLVVSFRPAEWLLLDRGADTKDQCLSLGQPVDIDHVSDSGVPWVALE